MPKSNFHIAALLAYLMAHATSSHAVEIDHSHVPTFGELSDLQAQEMYWDLKAKRDAKKAEADKYQVGPASLTAPTSGTRALPTLQGIVGSGQNLYGTFVYTNGTQVEARAGDILPGGFKVNSLSATKARLLVNGSAVEVIRSTGGSRSAFGQEPDLGATPGPMMLPGSPASVR